MSFLKVLVVSLLVVGTACHGTNKHSHENPNDDIELRIDLQNLFRQYGNNKFSMNTEQLREFLNEFDINHSGRDEQRYICLQDKIQGFNNLTMHWHNNSVIDRKTFSKISSYLVSYVTRCFGENYNGTVHYHIKEPKKLTSLEKFKRNVTSISKEKWLYAVLSVGIISIAGLFCVVVIPALNACCFDYLFQFLVALALGTLAGDALLHLIPHAFMSEHNHEELTFLDDFESEHPKPSHQYGIYKGLGCLAGMYVFFLIEKCVQMKQVDKPGLDTKKLDKIMKNEYDDEGIDMQLLNKTEKKPHSHGHSHSKKGDQLQSNAWMVILGDGLHNFSDGLAIGASFAVSLTAGFGTTIAVFCHELPHEIGDFAVLRRAGVSMKKAVLFNIVSSALCFVGVVVGILIGGIESANEWIFLFIAGTFIYISLVDIIPELNENGTAHDTKILNFFIQNCGIMIGVGIMLLIALYEDQIHAVLE